MSKTSKIILAALGVIALAVATSLIVVGLRGGGNSTEAGGPENGAWITKIKESGQLRVGIASAPPMTGEQENGEMGGPNVLPLENLAAELGVEFVPVASEWANMVAGLQSDRFDVAAYLDATSERSLAIRFTAPVYTYEGAFAVRADSGLRSTEDIVAAGTVAIGAGTTAEPAMEALGMELQTADAIPQAITAMKAGRAEAAFADLPTIADAAAKDPEIKVVVPNPVIFQQDSNYGVISSIDGWSMEVLNIAIRSAQNDGSLEAAFTEAGIYTPSTLGDLEMQ